ncbi:MAG: hypothetical protein M3Z41_00230 [Candidatus Eremiobacteraeota bacterium]|nr:hypothetical protein [Candidatus Eremiobacteraeota bacterium]
MKKRWLVAILVALPLAAAANVTFYARVPYLPVPKGSAVILNTGSTNASGYRIVVTPGGLAEYVTSTARATGSVAPELATKLLADLKAAAPLQQLPHSACMKSASFGTSLFVWWNHQRSPDLSCPADARGRALQSDAQQIAQALHIDRSGWQPIMRPLGPGEQHKQLPPAPTPTSTM